jgi:hypothetical protein
MALQERERAEHNRNRHERRQPNVSAPGQSSNNTL